MYARRSEEIVGISQSTRLFAKIIFDPMAGIFSPTGSKTSSHFIGKWFRETGRIRKNDARTLDRGN